MILSHSNTCRVRRELRTCQHPGCTKKFEGSPTSLYCPEHRTRKCRAERAVPKEPIRPEEVNLVMAEDITSPRQLKRNCSLDGCGKEYTFTVYPDHNVYPMYCELHRTEFKRQHFLRMLGKGKSIRYERPTYDKWHDYEMQIEQYALQEPVISPFEFRRRRSNAG